ncbi:MAG TPA: hypothetical protein VD866_21565, partial [Urbifossiella sp.]|nr:hypothetical protein [Urbifossiella sp.]
LILRCYRFDYQSHKYTPNVMLAVRAAGVLTVIGLIAAVVYFKVRERRRQTALARVGTTADAGPGPGEDATC